MTTVFAALADDNRRRIVESLADSDVATATGLAGALGISRQATAKHLEILAHAGLVTASKQGRERIYRFTPFPLGDVQAWISGVEGEWTGRLSRLAAQLEDRGRESPEIT